MRFRCMLAGMALLIGSMALLRGEWLVGFYWLFVELYWGISTLNDMQSDTEGGLPNHEQVTGL